VRPVVEQLVEDKEFVVSQVRSLEPGTTESDLAAAVVAAMDSLHEEKRRREKEIHIITDGQNLPWAGFARSDTDTEAEPEDTAANAATDEPVEPASASIDLWQPEKLDKRTAIFVTLVGAESPENVSAVDVEIQPQLIMADMPSRVQVRLAKVGEVTDSTVTITVDGEEVSRRAVSLEEGDAGELAFTLPPLEPGIHAARLDLPPDNLAVDDQFYFLIRVRETLPCLCVGPPDDTFFLMKALTARLHGGSAITVKRVGADDLGGEDLNDYACVFLCNALPLPGQIIFKIEDFVRAGGLVALFPGDRALVRDYEPWRCLPGQPAGIRDIPLGDRKRILRWALPQHPILRSLSVGPGMSPSLTIRRELVWSDLDKTAEPLVFAGPDRHFLLERPFGEGRVLVFSVAADRSWSNFPLSPFYLPFAHQTAQFGAGIAGTAPFLRTTRNLPLAEVLPSATSDSALTDPEGNPVPISSSIIETRTVLNAEELLKPGVYRFTKSFTDDPQPGIAVNLNSGESNLAPVEKEEIPDILGTKAVAVATGSDELLEKIEEHRIGRTLAEQALWLAFLLAIAEVYYANRKAKAGSRLTEMLGVDPAGKVHTKAHGE